MIDYNIIRIKNAVFYAYHGVMEDEQNLGGKFECDVEMYCDFAAAAESDSLDGRRWTTRRSTRSSRRRCWRRSTTCWRPWPRRIARGILREFSSVEKVTISDPEAASAGEGGGGPRRGGGHGAPMRTYRRVHRAGIESGRPGRHAERRQVDCARIDWRERGSWRDLRCYETTRSGKPGSGNVPERRDVSWRPPGTARASCGRLQRSRRHLGRTHGERWGPREIDLDILLYDGLVHGGPCSDCSASRTGAAPLRARPACGRSRLIWSIR